MSNTVDRFNDTVGLYLKYRPSYPSDILTELVTTKAFSSRSIIADIGSGTGFLTKLFLDHGNTVFGVEPNLGMKAAAEQYLAQYPTFHSIEATAENTKLAENSIDWITVGTAFHWFHVNKTKTEFTRILKSPGYVLLVWNVRDISQPLIRDYENLLLKYCNEYAKSQAETFNQSAVAEFFLPFEMKTADFPNQQNFNWDALKGRLLSTSYCLKEANPNFSNMLNSLKDIYDKYQKNNIVAFHYVTKLYYGRLK